MVVSKHVTVVSKHISVVSKHGTVVSKPKKVPPLIGYQYQGFKVLLHYRGLFLNLSHVLI